LDEDLITAAITYAWERRRKITEIVKMRENMPMRIKVLASAVLWADANLLNLSLMNASNNFLAEPI
jgi:acetone carboxylase gamma subunit